MSRPRLLDLYSCQGGAGYGYHQAGFDVVGVDLDPQPRYPFTFYQADAIQTLKSMLEVKRRFGTVVYDAIHASPPCQAFTNAQKIMGNEHPDLLAPTRELLIELGIPYVIENVPGAPLREPVELCGAMFGLGTYRHRLFESNFTITPPEHPRHVIKTTKMGRTPVEGEMMHVVGNFSGVEKARKAMGIDWMTRDGLRESIPPAYTKFIGEQLIQQLEPARSAA